MPLNFPSNPVVGLTTSISDKVWEYGGKGWKLLPNEIQGVQGLQGTQGTQGIQGRQGTQGLQGVQGLSNQGVQGTQGTQGLQGVQGLGVQGVQGTSSSFGARTLVSGTTGTISVGSTANLDITGYKSYGLLKVGISSSGWLRLYIDSASRTADLVRIQGVDPAPDSGVIAEIISTGSTNIPMSPGVIGWNNDSPTNSTIYAAVKNTGLISTSFTVDLTVIKLEN